LVSLVTSLAIGSTSARGSAALPGLLAFERVVGTNSDVYTIAPDGKGLRRLTTWPRSDFAPSWSPTGRIAFTSDRTGAFELFTMTASGGSQKQLSKSGAPSNKTTPDWRNDGRSVAFAAGPTRRADIYVLTLGTVKLLNVTHSLTSDDTDPAWSPDGKQLAFSTRRGRRVIQRYIVSSRRLLPLTRGSGSETDPAWAPDGKRVAFTRRDSSGNYDIYVVDVRTRVEQRLTSGLAQDRDPTWSPDGSAIAFVTNRDRSDDYEIYVMGADGSNPTNVTRSPTTLDLSPDWSGTGVPAVGESSGTRSLQRAAGTCDDPVGTEGDDNLVGNGSDQLLCGKGGNDTIHAGGGKDDVRGGPGNDSVWGERGADSLQGGGGNDKLHGGRGPDLFYPGDGRDTIDGGKGNDRCLVCGPGDSVVRVELVNDI
jgi:TolB protein